MVTKANSEIFLSTFNKLEKHFKNNLFKGKWKSFKEMLKEGSRFNPIIWQFKEELFDFTNLRNAIVHNRSLDYQVIAEPHDFVVKRFSEITEQIINPDKVDKFHKKVFSCHLTDSLSKIINLYKNNLISQLPVLNEKMEVVEILNTSTIVYWLSKQNGNLSMETTIANVIKDKEYKGNYEIISSQTTVYHAAEIFKNSYQKAPVNKYYDALIITQNGQSNQAIQGIIVLSDIAMYL